MSQLVAIRPNVISGVTQKANQYIHQTVVRASLLEAHQMVAAQSQMPNITNLMCLILMQGLQHKHVLQVL